MSEVAATATGIELTEGQSLERVLEGQSLASSLLNGMRTLARGMDRAYLAMGYVCGFELLMLGLFITYQVIARKIGLVMAPGMDLMSGYVLAMASTWAFSYALRSGSHVRIDILLPFMGKRTRACADWVALGSILFFTSITAWKTWVMVLKSNEIGAVTNTYPLTPLWIPQTVVAIGFTMLGVTALHMMIHMLAEGSLPFVHKRMGGTESYQVVTHERSAIEEGVDSAV